MAIRAARPARVMPALLLATTSIVVLACMPAYAKVGVTTGTDGEPLGKPPNENERVLRIGIDVQANELITTGAKDRAHLVFLDGSALTVGPNARLTIDKFVYDPNSGNGELAVNASVGVLRFVGGKISKKGNVTVTTPSSTIGIRGAVAYFTVTQVKTTADFVYGKSMAVTAAGMTQTAYRPSQIITNLGSAPGAPTLLKPGSLNAALGQLEGSSSTSGGSTSPDQKAQSSGFSNTNSGQNPNINTNVQQNLPPNPNNNTLNNAINNAGVANQPVDSTPVNPPTQQTSTSNTSPPNPPTPPTPPTPPKPTIIVTQGRFLQELPYKPETFNPKTLTADINPDNNRPLLPTGSVLNQTATLTISNGNTLQVPWLPGQVFQFTGSTPFGPANGVGFVDQAGQFFAYNFTQLSNQRQFGLFGGTPTATANFPKSTAGQAPTIGAQQLVNLVNAGNIPFAPNSVGGDAQLKAAANASPLYTVYGSQPASSKGLQVTVSIAGSGASQKSYMGVFIANYGVNSADNSLYSTGTYAGSYRLGGGQQIGRVASTAATAATGQGQGTAIYGDTGQYMVYVPDRIVPPSMPSSGGNALRASSGGSPTEVQRVTGAALNQPYVGPSNSYYPVTMAAPASPEQINPNIGQNRTAQTGYGYVAGLVDVQTGGTISTRMPTTLLAQPTDVRISTDPTTSQVLGQLVLRGYDGSLFAPAELTVQLGGGSNKKGPTSAFIDNNTYAMTSHGPSTLRIGEQTFDVKSHAVLASANSAPVQLPGMGSCTCEYLTWGWWSTSSKVKDGPLAGTEARVNLGTYVAGTLTTAIQMPQTGTATYNGLMVGNVNNAGNSYVAGGNFTMNYNYGARFGVTQMTFDNSSYRGTVSGTGTAGTNHVGGFVGANGVGVMKGSFYGPGAANVGGTFGINGTNPAYQASGIYAGQK